MIWCLALVCGLQLTAAVDWTSEDNLPGAEDTVKHLLLIGVHGIRTPLYGPFKGDLHFKKYPSGENQLTSEGRLQMGYVGRALRRRYYDLITKRSNAFTWAYITPESSATNDSVRVLSPALYPGRVPVRVVADKSSRDLDKTYMVYEDPGQSSCPLYTCLREKHRQQREEPTRAERDLYFLFNVVITQIARMFQLDQSMFNRRLEKHAFMKAVGYLTEDVLVYVFGWLMFEEEFEKEFSRPFSVEVGDTVLIELHRIDEKDVVKVFYYCPTSEDPDLRFKELSLKPFLEKNNIDSAQFLTSHLKLLLLPMPAAFECHKVGFWFRDDPYRPYPDDCGDLTKLSRFYDSSDEF